MRLKDKVAVVTGGGSGIGRGTALRFAQEGARVVVADLRRGTAQEAANAIRAAGGDAVAVGTDVTRSADVQAMVQTAVDRWGRLDILYACAGVAQTFIPIEDFAEEQYEQIFGVNVKGVFLCTKYAVPVMKRQGGGVIINMASTAGIRPRPGLSVYNASKGAVITLTRSTALELAPHRIRVVCICPVAADTPMLTEIMGPEADPEEGRRRLIATIPLGRLSRPEDMAAAAVYLASDEASLVTGVSLEVDGGRDL